MQGAVQELLCLRPYVILVRLLLEEAVLSTAGVLATEKWDQEMIQSPSWVNDIIIFSVIFYFCIRHDPFQITFWPSSSCNFIKPPWDMSEETTSSPVGPPKLKELSEREVGTLLWTLRLFIGRKQKKEWVGEGLGCEGTLPWMSGATLGKLLLSVVPYL